MNNNNFSTMKREITDDDSDLPLLKIVVVGTDRFIKGRVG